MFKLQCLKRCSKLSPPLQLPLDWYKTLIKFYLVLQWSSAAAGALSSWAWPVWVLCGGGAVWRLVSCLAAAAAVDCSGSGSGWEETGERQRSESRRPAPGSLALAGGMRPHRHTGTGDMSWLGITSPRPPINKLKISLSSGGGGESAVSIFTVYRAAVCAVCWPGCCVNIECPGSVNNLVANVRMTRRPILHPSRHGWLLLPRSD